MTPLNKAILALGIMGSAFVVWKITRRPRTNLRGRKESLHAMPRFWWRKKVPRSAAVCFRTKTDALNVFRDFNQRVIDDYGGETARVSPSEFDAINHRYDVKARTIAEALWAALPSRSPYCIDEIDIEALNDTSPGREHPVGFRVPDWVLEQKLLEQQERWYADQ